MRAHARRDGPGHEAFQIVIDAQLALAHRLAGAGAESERAAARARDAIAATRARPVMHGVLDGYTALAELALRAGDEPALAHACRDLGAFTRVFPVGVPARRRYEGELATLRGRPDAARAAFSRALAAAHRLDMDHERTLARERLDGRRAGGGRVTRPAAARSAIDAEVVARIDDIVAWSLANDSRVGYFASLYWHVATSLQRAAHAGGFTDPDRIDRLNHAFFARYLAAVDAFRAGQPTTGAWGVAFDATGRDDLLIVQHLLLGANAHIDLDLAIGVAEVVPADELAGFRPDFLRMNALLCGLIDGTCRDVTARRGRCCAPSAATRATRATPSSASCSATPVAAPGSRPSGSPRRPPPSALG